MKPTDLTGLRFGRWVVLSFDDSGKRVRWNCVCDCGKEKIVQANHLTSNASKSCGCLSKEITAMQFKTHGMSNSADKTFAVWRSMRSRCIAKSGSSHKKYAAKGVTVCDRWFKYENFLSDMGPKKEGMTLDRIDNALGYSPDNCRWATMKQQQNNKTNNLPVDIPSMSEKYGIKRATLYARFHRGVTLINDEERAAKG